MARVAVSYSGTSIQTANIVCQEFEHESLDNKQLDVQRLASRDGGKLLSATFTPRVIRIRGRLTYTTQANLETGIDTFKQLLNLTSRHLDIGYASGTRRYTCDTARLTLLRQHFNVTFAEWEAEFVCAKRPFGFTLDTSTASFPAVNSVATYAYSYVATGTYSPRPLIKWTFTEVANVDKIRVRNITTGDWIEVNKTAGYVNNDVVKIDCENYTVTINDVASDYTGIFPQFNPGGNDLRVSVGGTPAGGFYHYKATIKIVYYPLFL